MRLHAFVLLIIVAGGCRQLGGYGDPGTIDGPGTGPDSSDPLCYGSDGDPVHICFDAAPTGDAVFAGAFNTDSAVCATNVTSGGDGLCVIAGHTVDVRAATTISSTGTKPLVIVAGSTFTIEGTIDVSTKHNAQTHAGGADFAGCIAPATPAAGSNGGGAGGSFIGMGGDGGDPNHAAQVAGLADPTALHGGCPGGNGADGGQRGHGGGAVALLAGTSIDIMGQVNASGAGGGSQPDFAPPLLFLSAGGGGGGGSGGMIVLDAPTVNVSGIVFANGGGGGEGGTTSNTGRTGNDPANGAVGTGGSGGTGGDGGDGGAAATADGSPGMAGVAGSAGGGGGGGSVGAIRIYGSKTITGAISPPSP